MCGNEATSGGVEIIYSQEAHAQQVSMAVAAAVPGSGRATHRGGTRSEPRPGDQLVSGMKRMDLGAGGDAGGAMLRRGRREIAYVEKYTRPADLKDKRGKTTCVSFVTLKIALFRL